MTSQNDIIIGILEVLLRYTSYYQFVRPQIGQITQLRNTKSQKFKNIQYFYKK